MSTLPPLFVVCLTLCFESAGEGEAGMRRVASVIWNCAADHSVKSLAAECLKPKRYSCWNDKKPAVEHMRQWNSNWGDSQSYATAMQIANEMQKGKFRPIIEASHYFTLDRSPEWAKSMKFVEQYRSHVFYMEKG